MNYTTMMVDIVESKKIGQIVREELQIYIKECLDVLNGIFKPALEFEVIFSAGDEFQGLFRVPEAAILYYRLLKLLLAPIEIRCGIGYGKWDIRIEGGTSSEQDGPTYHYAREAIKLVQAKKEYGILFNSKSIKDQYLNILLNTSNLLMSQQSVKQRKVQLLVEILSPVIDNEFMKYDLDSLENIYKLIEVNSISRFVNIYPINISNFRVDILDDMDSEIKVIEAPKVKGLSSIIGEITRTSRQNIENTIKKANVGYIRSIDIISILYIKDNYNV